MQSEPTLVREGFYYEAAKLADGRFLVQESPSMRWINDEHPTLEAAQSHALALNTWRDNWPTAETVEPFFNPDLGNGMSDEARTSIGRLLSFFDGGVSIEARFDGVARAVTKLVEATPREIAGEAHERMLMWIEARVKLARENVQNVEVHA